MLVALCFVIFAPFMYFQCYNGFVACFIDLLGCCVHSFSSGVRGWNVLWSGGRGPGGDGLCDSQEAWRGGLDGAMLQH